MANYITKHWSKEVIKKRLENLKKVITPLIVEMEINRARNIADNELDALYIAYYKLKDDFCKIKRSSFGNPKIVEYRQKTINKYYTNYDPIEWTWTVYPSTSGTYYTTSSTTTASSFYDSWASTTILNR